MSKAIQVENLSKVYQIGEFSTGTLSRDIERWWALARGKDDPFLKIGETNVRSEKGESNVVWSLKDLNFEVEQGEAIGIIGKNGAGKSTLLKVLSQVTTPTTGTIKMKGRVASLLEVGTGFHPELTGRENIYLNGAILGMQKAEVKKKFDEIVDFSGVDRYIDTPVKRYSSGMTVRLAFAVAAHLDSEILIVDEVLAVGDAEFQKKCIGKMDEISKGEGRTVLFVSHVMESVMEFCKNSMLLEDGIIKDIGQSEKIIDSYLSNSHTSKPKTKKNDSVIYFESVNTMDEFGKTKNIFSYNENIYVKVKYTVKSIINNTIVWFDIRRSGEILFCSSDTDFSNSFTLKRDRGDYTAIVKLDKNFFNSGTYNLVFGINSYKPDLEYDRLENVSFRVHDDQEMDNPEFYQRIGLIKPIVEWNVTKEVKYE